MFNFFKRTKQLPPFETLAGFPKKDLYFVRTAPWFPFDNQLVTVVDPHNPRMLTMDPWPKTIFLEADGQRTVTEFIHYLANEYSGAIPHELDKLIIEELLKLAEYRIIEFSKEKRRPDAQFDKPRNLNK